MPDFQIVSLLKQICTKGASDVHFKAGKSPSIRVAGSIIKTAIPPLSKEDIMTILNEIVHKDDNLENLTSKNNLDFIYELQGVSRFRVNYCKDMGMPKITMRLIPIQIPSISELGLPAAIRELTELNNGIVLVTGPTGSGKSTTIASVLNTINKNQNKHVITIEDPVEFLFTDEKSLFTQRALGIDVDDFESGIRQALRQDPDVIVVGEIRDTATLASALAAAETGHLVFSTIHTNSAIQTINRMVNMFAESERPLAAERIANCLRATIAQKLLPGTTRKRVPGVEIMQVTSTVKDYIMKREYEEIYTLMQKGESSAMQTMNSSILGLYQADLITKDAAMLYSDDRTELNQLINGVIRGTTGTGAGVADGSIV